MTTLQDSTVEYKIAQARRWVDSHNVQRDGPHHAILFKVVRDDMRSVRAGKYGAIKYVLGQTVVAPDFRYTRDCGEGIHLSPSPTQARSFFSRRSWVVRRGLIYLACRVRIDEICPVYVIGHPAPKCKVPRCEVICRVTSRGTRPIEDLAVGTAVVERKTGLVWRVESIDDPGQYFPRVVLRRDTGHVHSVDRNSLTKSFTIPVVP